MSRPYESVPTLGKIAKWWIEDSPEEVQSRLYSWHIGAGEPFCFRCGWLAPVDDTVPLWKNWDGARGFLERAHLVDYALLDRAGRLDEDGVQNQVPLCQWCHPLQPMFELDQREEALEWVLSGERCPMFRQMASDNSVSLKGDRKRHRDRVDRVLSAIFLDGQSRPRGLGVSA